MRARLLPLLLAPLLLAGCGEEPPATPAAPEARATRITVVQARQQPVQVMDSTVGWIVGKSSPSLAAEVDGRLTRVLVDAGDRIDKGQLIAQVDAEPYRLARDAAAADVARLRALLDNARRQVERQRKMLAEKFVTAAAVEQAEAELRALGEQLRGAQLRLDNAQRDLANTQVRAPVAGVVDQRLVAAGDFARKGHPLLKLVAEDAAVRVHLPFPETLASQLRTGLPVRLTTPLSGQAIEGRIDELRPAVSAGSRAVEAVVDLPATAGWRPGASVRGRVVLTSRDGVVVPEVAVVDRPAGPTVYEIDQGKAQARVVRTGIVGEGWVEILEGLDAGATVALDGAGFLTDGALVKVQEQPR